MTITLYFYYYVAVINSIFFIPYFKLSEQEPIEMQSESSVS